MFKQLKFLITAFLCFLSFSPIACFGVSYSIHDLNLSSDQSYVSTINQNGIVTGKIRLKAGYYEEPYFDFIWSPKTGIQFFTFPASTSLPVMNNLNEVLGTGWFSPTSWFASGKLKHFYTANTAGTFLQEIIPPDSFPAQKLDDWQRPDLWDHNELAVLSCNDNGQFLVADFFDPAHAKKFAIWIPKNNYWGKGEFKLIDEKTLQQAYFINNQGIVLGKKWEKNQKSSFRSIVLYDLATEAVTTLFIDTGYTLKGFNDAGQICGWKMTHQADQLEGFLWDPEKGLQSLGDFLPTAINNKGQMVGNLKTDKTHLDYYLSQHTDAISQIKALKKHLWTPCVWLDNHAIPLQELLDTNYLPWTSILNLNGINDKGDMIGHALLDQKIQAILLTPNP